MRDKITIYDYVDKENPDAPGIYIAQSYGGEWEDKWETNLIASFDKSKIEAFIKEKEDFYDDIEKNAMDSEEYENIINAYENKIISDMFPGITQDEMTDEQWKQFYEVYDGIDSNNADILVKFIDEHYEKKFTKEVVSASAAKYETWYERPGFCILKIPFIG